MEVRLIPIEEAQQAMNEVDIIVVPVESLTPLSYNERIDKVRDKYLSLHNRGAISPFIILDDEGVIPILFNKRNLITFEFFLNTLKTYLKNKGEKVILFAIEKGDIKPVKRLIEARLRGIKGLSLLLDIVPLIEKDDLP